MPTVLELSALQDAMKTFVLLVLLGFLAQGDFFIALKSRELILELLIRPSFEMSILWGF